MILAVLMLSVGSVTYASGYEQQLAELNNLIKTCEEKNISVPYERIGVKTFERFINYLADDEKNGISADIMEYNNDAMQRLYAETAANLNAYIDGTKTPPMVPEYDMMNTSVSGMGITDGTNKVFSAGYGYFDTVKKDIENLHDFGMENMQIETGPDRIIGLPDWDYSASGAEYYFDVVSEENNRALKVVYKSESAENTYLVIRQKIWVSPSKRYYYKASYKGKNVDKNAVSIKVHGNASVETNIDPVSDTWQNTGWQSYKATDDEIGMSSHNPVTAKKAVETGLIDVLMFSLNPAYDLVPKEKDMTDIFTEVIEGKKQNFSYLTLEPVRAELYRTCEEMGVAITVMKALAMGTLLSKERSPLGVALTEAQCINYALSKPAVAAVMVGMQRISDVSSAVEYYSLTEEDCDHSIVGEKGPEMLTLPRGAQVTPLAKTTATKNTNHFDIRIYADGKSVDEIIDELIPKLKLALANL